MSAARPVGRGPYPGIAGEGNPRGPHEFIRMFHLLRFFSIRHAARRPWRVALSAGAVGLGVALYVSGAVTNHSTEAAFQDSNKELRGGADLQIDRGRMLGVEDSVLAKLDAIEGLRAAPMLQLSTTLPDFPAEANLMLLGVDFAREAKFRRWETAREAAGGGSGDGTEGAAGATSAAPTPGGLDALALLAGTGVIVSEAFAGRTGLSPGSTLRIDTPRGVMSLRVSATVKDSGPARVFGGNVAAVSVGTLQRMFDRAGVVDRIEVVVDDEARIPDLTETIRAALGPEHVVGPPPAGDVLMDDAMARVKAMMGISVVALIVAIFIIYNSVSISVVERIKEIGTLRAFGTTRGQILATILIEWTLVGAIGSVAGVLGGYVLAERLLAYTVKEVNNMIPLVVVREVAFPPFIVVAGLLLGMVTTLAASIFPARAAMGVSPVELLRQGLYRMRIGSAYFRQFQIGVGLIVLGAIGWSGWFTFAWAGLLSAVIGFLGQTFLLPQMTIWLSRASRPLLRGASCEAFMAADNNAKYPQRTALTVIALAGSIAMMISAASITLAFKVRGQTWLENTLPFDLSLNVNDMRKSAFSEQTFTEDLIPEIEALDPVKFAFGVRSTFVDIEGSTVMLSAPDLDDFERAHRERDGKPFVPEDALQELLAGGAVAVSENLAAIHDLDTGDELEIPTPSGARKFKVLAAIEDYSWPKGCIYMHRGTYKELWGEGGLTYLDVVLKEGVDPAAARAAVSAAIQGEHSLFIYSVKDIVSIAEEMMDQSLKFTNIQVRVAILIGFLGIVNTLLISVMQRKREIGLLRAIGMTREQVTRMIVIEAVFLAIFGGALGVLFGLIGAKWPLSFHVFQLTGFLIPFHVPWGTIGGAMLAAVALGFLASWIPARYASRLEVLDAIGYE